MTKEKKELEIEQEFHFSTTMPHIRAVTQYRTSGLMSFALQCHWAAPHPATSFKST